MTRLIALLFAFVAVPAAAADKPLKVYILAGQSNMQGHAKVSTFDSLADDPKTAPLLKTIRDSDGKPRVCERVWISSIGCQGNAYSDLREAQGKLTAGFGAPADKIGPEFTFGLAMEHHHDGPVLLIKTAWGGRSVHTDFRPPSAGPYTWSETELANFKKRGDDIEKKTAEKLAATGEYYRQMIKHVNVVLKDIKRVVPGYDPKRGYELAGFVWFQGWNDMVDGGVYPKRNESGGYDAYRDNLAHLIRDVRKDLDAPRMPVVIGVMGVGGLKENTKGAQKHFRDAQRQVAALAEFQGNVVAVETAPFWDDELEALQERMQQVNAKADQEAKKDATLTREQKDAAKAKAVAAAFKPEELKRLKAGVSNGGYHYLGAAKILAPIGRAFAEALIQKPVPTATPRPAEMAGYLLVPHEKVSDEFNGGFSLYVPAWPLLKDYPGNSFQSGLPGTWMHARLPDPHPKNHYSDIEGGLGWWRDTRFATVTPKFIMGGVALNFSEWANGPGAGKGRNWTKPAGHYGIAQLSPWLLWPPDGLNLKSGSSGELVGYGYLPLPLTESKTTTAGQPVPTGNQCWTLFLNTGNFKGPVAFFTPYFWTKPTVKDAATAGTFLDVRPANPNKALQMETQHIPAAIATDTKGDTYARVAPTRFPRNAAGETVLVHRLAAYRKAALWDDVAKWFDGGTPVDGRIPAAHTTLHEFKGGGGSTWRIYEPKAGKDQRPPLDWKSFATPVALDAPTAGYRWNDKLVNAGDRLITLPEYYKRTTANGKEQWAMVAAADVPAETGLAEVRFTAAAGKPQPPYETPEDGSWKTPGPVAGPFTATLGDGSTITYSWYRFADQPALLNADLTAAEREAMQHRVEKLHRHWTRDKDYLAPPTVGVLADLDPALVVTPPRGLEVGYVPIVTRQAAK